MRIDGMAESEAIELVKETREQILNSDLFDADDIILDNLGLEPDYLMDILDF